MRKILYVFLALVIILGMVGCAGGAKPKEKPKEEPKEKPKEEPVKVEPQIEEWVIVDHKTKDFGGNVPRWVTRTPLQLQQEDMYKDYYVFIEDSIGKDLDGIKLWSTNFAINANIARMVATRVESRFAGAAVGDKDMVETYMENVVKSVSAATFSRVVVEDEFWIKKQSKKSGDVEYRYLFLVTVPRSEIEAAIERAFGEQDEANKPKTEEEKVARDRVKEAFKEGF